MEHEGENLEDYEAIEDNRGVDIQNSDGEGNENAGGGEEDEDKPKKVIKPRKVIRNPQPKLNAETLKGPRGLSALPGLFAKQKFQGKGKEKEDLEVLLNTYKYWCHRMIPKYPFEQAIEKIEQLGTKKPIITYLKKMRMGLLVEEEQDLEKREDEEERQPTQQVDTGRDSEFDALLPPKPAESQPARLTEEQQERIRANKEKALKLRQERLRKIRRQAESKLKPSHTSVTDSQDVIGDSSLNTEGEIGSQNDTVDKSHSGDTEPGYLKKHGNEDNIASLKDHDSFKMKENKSGYSTDLTQGDKSDDVLTSALEFSSQDSDIFPTTKPVFNHDQAKSEDVSSDEMNFSSSEGEFDAQDNNIVPTSKSVLEEDFDLDRAESQVLGRGNVGKRKISSSTMIQGGVVFEETATKGFDNTESTTLRVDGLGEADALLDEARLRDDLLSGENGMKERDSYFDNTESTTLRVDGLREADALLDEAKLCDDLLSAENGMKERGNYMEVD